MPTMPVHKGELAYEVTGPEGADPVLVLPGAATSQWMYHPLRDHLKERFRVVTFDYRGMGGSRNDLWHVTPAQLAEDALHLMDTLCLGPVHTASISLGTFVLAEMLHKQPSAVARCAIGAMPALRDRWHLPREAMEALDREAESMQDMDELKTLVAPMFFTRRFREEQPQRYAETLQRLKDQSAWELLAGLQQFWGGFGWDWGRLRVFDALGPGQRLFLTGGEDFLARLEDVREHPLLAKGPTVVVQGSGHVFFYEHPELYNPLVGHFFATGDLPDPLPGEPGALRRLEDLA